MRHAAPRLVTDLRQPPTGSIVDDLLVVKRLAASMSNREHGEPIRHLVHKYAGLSFD